MHGKNLDAFVMPRQDSPIYEGLVDGIDRATGLAKALFEEVTDNRSHQPTEHVRYLPHPINFSVASQMRKMSPHHAACLDQLTDAAIGLGYKEDAAKKRKTEMEGEIETDSDEDAKLNEIADALDPLCGGPGCWEALLDQATADAASVGNGYIEVSRGRSSDKINGLFWVPAPTVHIALEPDRFQWFRQTKAGTWSGGATLTRDHVPFARFGMIDDTTEYEEPKTWSSLERKLPVGRPKKSVPDTNKLHELIHFKLPTNQWELYGGPRYLSAVPYIHLVQQMVQQQSDLFHNRGVPDFLLFLLGVSLGEDDWTNLKNMVMARTGNANVGKAGVFQVKEAADKASVEMLQMADGSAAAETISKLHDAMALSICSAHRVPPLLAGITVSGKQGAANELVQSLILFEKQVVRRFRRMVTRTLAGTLGHPELGVEGLAGEKFEFASIIDQLDMFTVDSIAKAKGEAAAQPDRDFAEGTQKRGPASSGKQT
jgi:capsid portal protein